MVSCLNGDAEMWRETFSFSVSMGTVLGGSIALLLASTLRPANAYAFSVPTHRTACAGNFCQ